MKYAKLIFKNILRNKRRTLLTISSLVVSLFLIISLATILTEFDRGTEEASPLRLVSRHAVSLGFVIPMAHLQKMKTVPGVKEAMPFSWFGGIYKDERNFFANFAVDARKMRDVIPEIKMSDADWQAFINDRQGAIVGAKLVKLYGFTPGQRITSEESDLQPGVSSSSFAASTPEAMRRRCTFSTTISTSCFQPGPRIRSALSAFSLTRPKTYRAWARQSTPSLPTPTRPQRPKANANSLSVSKP